MAEEFKYEKGIARLEVIVHDIENNTLDVDSLVDQLKEAKDIIKKCKNVLFKVEEELKKVSDSEEDEVK